MLSGDETLPASISEAASLVGLSPYLLQKHFPDVCDALAEKYAIAMVPVQQALEVILDQANITPIPPLTVIAIGLGYQPDTLRGHFPELCKAITVRRKEQRSKEHLQIQLEAVRYNPSDPPLSMAEVSRRLGVHSTTLRIHFPELYAEIVLQRQEYWKRRSSARKEAAKEQILTAIEIVDSQNEYPSARRVARHLPSISMLKEAEFASIWREEIQKLKDRKRNSDSTQ